MPRGARKAASLSGEVTVDSARGLGAAIGSLRQELGLTRAELGEWLRVDETYVGRLERGESVQRLERLLDALDLVGLELVVRRKAERR
jgi:HTH-type transcriptional regulator / antitoxin HipB